MEENCYAQTKKTRAKRLVSGAACGDAYIQRGGFYAAAPGQGF
jgi:hypothetical protein